MNTAEPYDEWVRQSLESLEDLPPESFKQAEVWKRLHAELHTKPVAKPKVLWKRWVAVAVLLFVCGTSGIMSLRQIETAQPQTHQKNGFQPIKKQPIAVQSAPALGERVVPKRLTKFKEVTSTHRNDNSLDEANLAATKPADEPMVQTKVLESELVEEGVEEKINVQTTENQKIESDLMIKTAATKPKAHFRIVHQNELNQTEAVGVQVVNAQTLMITVNVGRSTREPSSANDYPNSIPLSRKSKTKR